ncbi:MAG TPA: LamG-like jellyroll fold domain-containing protein [Flavobacterium sp.]|jgi:hypothetical protein|nr:LamG-like jellyroll fold domain-containing protein [Flavobacterium sp.]
MRKITILMLLVITNMAAQGITDNLLLHYSFDNNAIDQVNSYNATPFNIVYGADRNGNPASAAYFNGINSYVNFPNLLALKPQLPVSFSFWIKYDSNQFEQQVVFNTSYEENHATSVVFNASGANQYVINYADGQYIYAPSSRRSYVSNLTVDTSQWKHIAVVVNSATDMKIYIDCVETGGTYSGSGGALQYSLQPGCLGRHDRDLDADPGYFKGSIDDFMYWDRSLTPADVALLCQSLAVENFATKKTLVYPNPVDGILNLSSDTAEEVAIYDSFGRKVYEANYARTLDLSSLPAGIYLLQIAGNGKSETHKIVIK